VAQQIHVIDRVSAGSHPGDQAAGLHIRARPGPGPDLHMPADQRAKPGPLRQSHHRDQPGTRHQIRIIEQRRDLRRVV
jgi:hypothetical protein